MTSRSTKLHRLAICNRILCVIASHGRRFFSQDADQPRMANPRVSSFSLDYRGRVWFTDRYTGRLIYVAHNGRWRGFSEGGTLRSLIKNMYLFIKDGTPIASWRFGPWPLWICGGDLWGYGDAMDVVRSKLEPLLEEAAAYCDHPRAEVGYRESAAQTGVTQ